MESKLIEAVLDGIEDFCQSQSGRQLKFLCRMELPSYLDIPPGSELERKVKGIQKSAI